MKAALRGILRSATAKERKRSDSTVPHSLKRRLSRFGFLAKAKGKLPTKMVRAVAVACGAMRGAMHSPICSQPPLSTRILDKLVPQALC
eukprot:COSAG01_NODE_17953_length_1112_cov_0.943731_2_plen_89_part_01